MMNVHEIAEECAECYLNNLIDHNVSHADNVKNELRKIVEYWTKRLLLSEDENDHTKWKDEFSEKKKNQDAGEEESEKMDLSLRSKCRMEAFLAGCSYALPNDPFPMTTKTSTTGVTMDNTKNSLKSSSLRATLQQRFRNFVDNQKNEFQNGTNGSSSNDHVENAESFSMSSNNSSVSSSSSSKLIAMNKRNTYPQFHVQDLTLRLEIYLRSLRRLKANYSSNNDCNSHINSNNSHNSKSKVVEECLLACEPTRSLKARVNLLVQAFVTTVSCVHSMRPILTNLLQTMTQELLAVPTLAEELTQASIPNVVKQYEHLTSFASLAFLSTPERAAHQLYQLILQYVEFLSSDWSRHVQSCHLEQMLSTTIPPKLRSFFKNIEFSSIGHLLEICNQHSASLESIPLQQFTASTNCHDEKKILKQAMRDLRRETITVNGHILPPVTSYKELCRNLADALNSRTMTLRNHNKHSKPNHKLKNNTDETQSPPTSGTDSDHQSKLKKIVSECDSDITKFTSSNPSSGDDDFLFSSGNEGDTDDVHHNQQAPTRKGHHVKGRRFGVDTIDLMTRRLLAAASRTGIGGDAYFVVRDLFGGDGVNVVPSSHVVSFSPSYRYNYDNYGNYNPRVTRRSGTIELIVRLSTVTIKCHSRYDVYPDNPNRFDEHHDEPLITLHTTTTENIYLHEVRVNEDGTELLTAVECENVTNQKHTVVMLKEKKTPLSGCRTLSIRPAKYEKVFDYHTPS